MTTTEENSRRITAMVYLPPGGVPSYADEPVLKAMVTNEHNNVFVPGVGPPDPVAVFVGEAPGATEILTGSPFTGAAGMRLDTLLDKVALYRSRCWITNVVKLRPTRPDGRDRAPREDEIRVSMPYLWRELEIAAGHSTRVICALGRTAATALCGGNVPVGRYHGQWRVVTDPAGMKWALFVTYHPSAALRSEEVNELLLADLRAFRQEVTSFGVQARERLAAG